MKKKYAMVGINSRQNENGEELVRRVLIQYKSYKKNVFSGTRFLEKDSYFYDKTKSHQYEFKDEGYILVSSNNEFSLGEKHLIDNLRPYHYRPEYAEMFGLGDKIKPILFKAKTDEDAIKLFTERKELR